MGSLAAENHHAVCIPYPAQGHMNPMLKLAKLLHSLGFHITFVLTEFNYNRLLRSQGPNSVKGLPDFRFETIPDGLPISEDDSTQDVPTLSESTTKNFLAPFCSLITKLNERSPPVSCIVSDGVMTFTLDAAQAFGIPEVLFWTASACGYLAYLHYQHLLDRGIIPLKSAEDMNNGFLDTRVDWIPGLTEGMSLKDFPSFIRTTDSEDIMLNFVLRETSRASMADAILINTFEDLEAPALDSLRKILPPMYAIGPLSLLARRTISSKSPLADITASLWNEDNRCLLWLDSKPPESVVYVNFGSITVMTNEQLIEFAWGLANSRYNFLWVIRPDLVKGESAVLPPEFMEEIKERGLMTSWCVQEELLTHPAVGVFLTHSGWNSTLESLCGGVPMICWPFFAEQQTNCKYACTDWGVGMEIDNNVKRNEVKELIREMMAGGKGKKMREKAVEWKESAANAIGPNGRSAINLYKVVNDVLKRN
ncbi:7-deoxyloganetin glucosyltransferase-like [Phalaenopsis equestris]|uniref:7-deoxyloganetin glucosyltransferase-like n=1 Tax=Phalaenopsis equestris TaxID=78828 RepID=UPI0009E4DAF0|nr:7-deoxyloganetin glucosyltransferase-like [Phalaenopsis equestris]